MTSALDAATTTPVLPPPTAGVAARVLADAEGRHWICGVEEETNSWLWLPLD